MSRGNEALFQPVMANPQFPFFNVAGKGPHAWTPPDPRARRGLHMGRLLNARIINETHLLQFPRGMV